MGLQYTFHWGDMAYTFMYVQCSYTLSMVWGNKSFVRKQGRIVHKSGKENINKTI